MVAVSDGWWQGEIDLKRPRKDSSILQVPLSPVRTTRMNVVLVCTLLAGAMLTCWRMNVSTRLTQADIRVFEKYYGLTPEPPKTRSFDDEILLIRHIQRMVLKAAPADVGIPEYASREPEDLIRAHAGLCYDRSRSIEKALTFSNFKVRHVFLVYSKGKSFISALSERRQPSHAVSEVLTTRGWLVVDSNSDWISLTDNGQPVSDRNIGTRRTEFSTIPRSFTELYWSISGLYSRSGSLYSPYLPIPRVHWYDLGLSIVE